MDVQRVVAELVACVHGHAAGQQLSDAVEVAVARRDPDVLPVAALVAAAVHHRHSTGVEAQRARPSKYGPRRRSEAEERRATKKDVGADGGFGGRRQRDGDV